MISSLKYITIFCISAFVSISFCSCSNKSEADTKNVTIGPVDSLIQKTDSLSFDTLISVIGVGDIMMGTTYPNNALPLDDGEYLFDEVTDVLTNADVTFGNLEGPLLDQGGTPKQCIDSKNCVAFRMPEHYAQYLKDAGFDIVSLANNHNGDMGIEGRISTMKTLDNYKIGYSGLFDHSKYIFEKDGVKFGFAAFAPNNGTCSILDIEKSKETVKSLKDSCDIVIVSFHGGREGTSFQHVPKHEEYFLGKDRGNVYEFTHSMIDAGADIIFGQGPHVTRAIELYNGRLICYSLGNFCTYSKFDLSGELGYAPIMKVFVNKKGEFIKGNIYSIKQINHGFPVIDEDGKVIQIIKKLSIQDFPDSDLKIDDNGNLNRSTNNGT